MIADRVKQATARSSVHAALQTHLDGALVRIAELYKGERLLGRETAVLIVSALRRALATARPPRLEAGARAFCADLGIHVGTAVASAALAIVLLVTPVLRRPSRYRWLADLATLKACRHGDMALESVLSWPFLTPESAAETDASEQDDAPRDFNSSGSPDEAHIEHACGVVPSPYSAADEVFGEPEDLGGLGGASAPPAEQAGASPATPPASDGDAPLRAWTKSEWLLAIPRWPQIQRAATLALAYLPPEGFARTATELAATLAGFDRLTRASSRTRAQLARGLESLCRRGLLVVDDGRWFMPEWRANPVLELYGVAEKPSSRAPSAKMLASLEARGVVLEPRTLSHEEAVALNRRLHTRKVQEQPHPRLLAAVVREEAKANLPTDLRATGRLDVAEAREALRRAMDKRSNDEEIGRHEGWWH